MANTHKLFQKYNSELQITNTKNTRLIVSRNNLRERIRQYFLKSHPKYVPSFWMQGSYKMNTTIRTKDDTCDIDDGVYFKNNPDEVTCTTLQSWIKNAVDGATNDISHRKMCITVNYVADYNIDLPVYIFNEVADAHPKIAVKGDVWREDDPKDMVFEFQKKKKDNPQLLRIVRYLKAWCDHKRNKMPSGLAMTILAMNNHKKNERDDISLKYTLIEIENTLKLKFTCVVPATPCDDIFSEYDKEREKKIMDNLAAFISDAKEAIDELNELKASKLWRKHLGDRFPIGEDKEEVKLNANIIIPAIGNSRPYYAG